MGKWDVKVGFISRLPVHHYHWLSGSSQTESRPDAAVSHAGGSPRRCGGPPGPGWTGSSSEAPPLLCFHWVRGSLSGEPQQTGRAASRPASSCQRCPHWPEPCVPRGSDVACCLPHVHWGAAEKKPNPNVCVNPCSIAFVSLLLLIWIWRYPTAKIKLN